MSEFDSLSWEIVTELKEKYPSIKRVYVRASYKNMSGFYAEYLQKSYEETYFAPKAEKARKYSYVERNYEMIDNSTYCVFYYNKDYVPKLKAGLKRNHLSPTRRNSGTKIAYEYAMKKKKEIINLYK